MFEDEADRKAFLSAMVRNRKNSDLQVIAWCLMDNHFHMLLKGDLGMIAGFMMGVLSLYARCFNARYDRRGHVFQSRFGSQPIESDEYLIQAVRYIHQNPEKAGIALTSAYRWSSYREYVGRPVLTDTTLVLAMIGSVAEFEALHHMPAEISLIEPGDKSGEMAAKRALQTAIDELGFELLHAIRTLPRGDRDRCLERLRNRGLTVRQIERITGVSRGIIAHAVRNTETEKIPPKRYPQPL